MLPLLVEKEGNASMLRISQYRLIAISRWSPSIPALHASPSARISSDPSVGAPSSPAKYGRNLLSEIAQTSGWLWQISSAIRNLRKNHKQRQIVCVSTRRARQAVRVQGEA